jgi:hypothetical protein
MTKLLKLGKWRMFWANISDTAEKMDQGVKSPKKFKHPLTEIRRQYQYDIVRHANSLYGDLSGIVHGFESLREDSLLDHQWSPDVYKLLKVLKPVHVNRHGVVDWQKERERL